MASFASRLGCLTMFSLRIHHCSLCGVAAAVRRAAVRRCGCASLRRALLRMRVAADACRCGCVSLRMRVAADACRCGRASVAYVTSLRLCVRSLCDVAAAVRCCGCALLRLCCFRCVAFAALPSLRCLRCVAFAALPSLRCLRCVAFAALPSLRCFRCVAFAALLSLFLDAFRDAFGPFVMPSLMPYGPFVMMPYGPSVMPLRPVLPTALVAFSTCDALRRPVMPCGDL